MKRPIVFLLYDQFAAIDAAGPADVFATANDLARRELYALRYISLTGVVKASNGMAFTTGSLGQNVPTSDRTLMVPGAAAGPMRAAVKNAELVAYVQRSSAADERVCSVCSGAFVLARAGLLNGRRATTHWRGIEQLASLYPQIKLETDALFVEDRGVWTSAGVTAGIDMALAMVERDHGRPLAMKVAREMVLFMVRPGGQTQFSAPLDLQQKAADTALASLPFWLESRLEQPVNVADMAASVAMSERNFHRRCVTTFGLTPNALLQRLRMERARRLLEEGLMPTADIAKQVGLGDVSALGKSFRQHFAVTPGDYRSHFGKIQSALGE